MLFIGCGPIEFDPVRDDPSLPFRCGFRADMTKRLLHLPKPVPRLTTMMRRCRIRWTGRDKPDVTFYLPKPSMRKLQSLFAALAQASRLSLGYVNRSRLDRYSTGDSKRQAFSASRRKKPRAPYWRRSSRSDCS
jgi:hypothetical protein